MNKLVATTILVLPLAVAFPALAQQGSGAPEQPPPGAAQSNQSGSPMPQPAPRRAGQENSNAAINLSPDQIEQLQRALNDNGFDAGAVDGVFGPSTSAALRRFQDKAGLQPTGRVDAQTLSLVGLSGRIPAPAGRDQTTGQGAAGGQPANPSTQPTPRNQGSN